MMKKRLLSLLLVIVMVLGMLPANVFAVSTEADYELRTLTFEDADYKGETTFAGGNDCTVMVWAIPAKRKPTAGMTRTTRN